MLNFLITTSLLEFRNYEQKEIFLGEWCKSSLKDFKETMPYIWNDSAKILYAINQTEKYYEYFLEVLTENLNKIHSINKSKQYYKIILGSWLFYYINASFDRYSNIENFQKKYGDFLTYLLDEKQFYTPQDFSDYTRIIQEDKYNLQIYSKIIKYQFGDIFESRKLDSEIEELSKNNILKDILKKYIANTTYFLTSFQKETILISKPYFGENGILKVLKVIFASKFRAFVDEQKINHNFSKTNKKLRQNFISSKNKSFKNYILENIMLDIPKIFLEDFQSFREKTLQSFNKIPKIIYTSTGLQTDDRLKFFLAENYKDIFVAINQHGASYGTASVHSIEKYEKSISNIFLTSGWKNDNKTVPFGLPKLDKNLNIKLSQDRIVYITTSNPKFLYRFEIYPLSGYFLKDFFERMEKILRGLDVKNLYIRPYPNQYSRDRIDSIISNNNLNIQIDKSKNISEVLSRSKLVIFDHFGTTMLESLYFNIPTVVILDKEIESFRENSLEIIRNLENNKIIFFSIEKAIQHINSVNIDNWWKSENVQYAKDRFVEKYATLPKNWERKLIQLLDKEYRKRESKR